MSIACYVSAPVTSFRAPRAREYLETLPVPPPATVYGMLCSAVGEHDRLVQQGAEIAIGVLSAGRRSRVLRTSWRVKDAKTPPGLDENKRPDFQELLTAARFVVHVRAGEAERAPSLEERVRAALDNPASVTREGGLSLGESTHLVDELRRLRHEDAAAVTWLVADVAGDLPLPAWVDHVGSAGTRYVQVRLVEAADPAAPPLEAWITIAAPTDASRNADGMRMDDG